MCGIVGYVGSRLASPVLLDCLRHLEYRGYDSAGIASLGEEGLCVTRASGKLSHLEQRLSGRLDGATVGIGHTRWATHGRPTDDNAHPHRSHDGKVAVVHNGIIENFAELREELARNGYTLRSETDTECFPMLVGHYMNEGMTFDGAFREAIRRIDGVYAIACIHEEDPGRLLAARSGPPLVVGLGDGENFLASDVTALVKYTRDVIFLEDHQVAELTAGSVRISSVDGEPLAVTPQRVAWDSESVELGRYQHYMQKEILEQPRAVADTLMSRLPVGDEGIELSLPWSDEDLRGLERVLILACGTSWHAGLVGKFLIERLAGIPTEVDYASEYRYRTAVAPRNTLAIAITQSGETADTLAALGEAKRRGAKTLAICNVKGSQITRLADATLLTRAGPEIGVASTKAFTSQLIVLSLLAMHFGDVGGAMGRDTRDALMLGLRSLPSQLEAMHGLNEPIKELAERWKWAQSALYIGRGILYPIALEGALKLKEISYIHAEGYPAGEMKHGPIALIDQNLPVVALVANDDQRARVISNVQEAAARDGQVLAFVTQGDRELDGIASSVVELPSTHPLLAPTVFAVPLQLFAYHVAALRGCDVDQPRNLAKSVTVE